jgi:mannose-1-phosphate guanylyltransferase
MKAFLLAAGQGTRLRPYTDTMPKCLIPIHGRPLLAIWIDLLAHHGVRDIMVNTHYLAEQVETFVRQYRPLTPARLATCFEPTLLGSAGTLWTNREFVNDGRPFVIAYADNLTDLDLSDMVAFHHTCRVRGGLLTMGLFRAPDPAACGIAVLDDDLRVVRFEEKPTRPPGNWANAGIYVASPAIFDYFPSHATPPTDRVLDLGYHILPRLTGKTFGYKLTSYLRDIGTVASYHLALEEWPVKGDRCK